MIRVEISVENVAQLQAKLAKFKADSRRLKPAFEKITGRTMIMARFQAPRFGGRTRASLRGKAANMASSVKAGNATRKSHGGGIYVKLNHFGTRWDGQRPNPWLYRTLAAQRTFAVQTVRRELINQKDAAGL